MKISVSEKIDGNMKGDDQSVVSNRHQYLVKNGYMPERSCIVSLVYEGEDYCRYRSVDDTNFGGGIGNLEVAAADGIFTKIKDLALFLPLADCVGAVIWDASESGLMLSHLGRHSVEQFGGSKSIEYFSTQTRCDPKDIHVYLSPAAGKKSYPLYAFSGNGLQETVVQQIESTGVPGSNICIDARDTTLVDTLFSHSEYLKGRRISDERFMVVSSL